MHNYQYAYLQRRTKIFIQYFSLNTLLKFKHGINYFKETFLAYLSFIEYFVH